MEDAALGPMEKLREYYRHQMDLLKGYEKDPEKLQAHSAIIAGWLDEIDRFLGQMNR